jgi:hypothetical protein
MKTKSYKLITCAVLYREIYYCASLSRNFIDVTIIDQGLHDIGEAKMSSRLQHEINSLDTKRYNAILLGYGLCNNGIRGLQADIPLVIPRAHDCITLLLGSKERYKEHFESNPGTFYSSVGWVEQAKNNLLNPESTTSLMGMKTYDEYVQEYGEENAKYIVETLGNGLNHYNKYVYIDTGVGNQNKQKEIVKERSLQNNWKYEEVEGSTHLLLKMMNGEWDKDKFLVIEPGITLEPSHDALIIRKKKKV